MDKEARQELSEFKKELKKQELQKRYLLNKEADFGLLEDLVKKCNANPNLTVTVKLGDGTVLELKTVVEKTHNPIFESFSEGDVL